MGAFAHIICLLVLQTGPISSPFTSPSAPVSLMSGNGFLTAGVDKETVVRVCRWPSPGYYDHIQATASGEGIAWAVQLGDRTLMLNDAAWKSSSTYADHDSPICQTRATLTGTSVRATVTTFVHARKDILLSRIVVEGADTAPVLYWVTGLSPRTCLIPELPILNTLCTANGGFAIFTPDRGTTMFHFRPTAPGAAEWAKTGEMVSSPAFLGPWTGFGKGVWIGSTVLGEVREFECGPEENTPFSAMGWNRKNLNSVEATPGPGYGIQAIAPAVDNARYSATAVVAFGEDASQIQTALTYARETGYNTLVAETRAHWRERLAQAAMPAGDNVETVNACKRDLLTLLQSMDVCTGAVVRAPVGPPWQAVDSPRAGAWITLALDLAGYRDLADSHTWFYARQLRERDTRGAPAGSLPAALYPNGKEAVPPVVFESDTVAWMLASMWRHGMFLDEQQRRVYFDLRWDAVQRAATFLAGWSDTLTREPLPSFNPNMGRDDCPTGLVLTTFMGMDSALRIAAALGKKAPDEWKNRKLDLDILLRFHVVAEKGRWRTDTILPFWAPEFAEAGLPAWDAVLDAKLAVSPKNNSVEFLETLCAAALVWQDKPDKLAQVKSLLDTVPPVSSQDTLDSAVRYIVTLLTDGTHHLNALKPKTEAAQTP